MSKPLKKINNLIANADPNNYDSISYGKYYRDLTTISDAIIDYHETLKTEIMKISNDSLRLKLLELL